MSSSDESQSRIWPWIRWFLLSEGLILFFALAGPGYRHRGDHTLFARWVMEDPSYLDAVLVNFVTMNIMVACAWLAAWLVTRLRKDD